MTGGVYDFFFLTGAARATEVAYDIDRSPTYRLNWSHYLCEALKMDCHNNQRLQQRHFRKLCLMSTYEIEELVILYSDLTNNRILQTRCGQIH